ncbi:Hypothetical predicted protein [Podarcis lilfordi]|uniref:Uncharacterized protein n=1 Tax=Podarcis lilfordi TaxID=74358 RepID=A0AA35JT34_9SAUR|nr:Hypothetical predicted protein [Podarcis lilfordi]
METERGRGGRQKERGDSGGMGATHHPRQGDQVVLPGASELGEPNFHMRARGSSSFPFSPNLSHLLGFCRIAMLCGLSVCLHFLIWKKPHVAFSWSSIAASISCQHCDSGHSPGSPFD